MNVGQQKGALLDSSVAWLLEEVERLGRVVDGATADLVSVPVGGVIFWPSGAIPAGFAEYTALQDRVPIGAGGTFVNGTSGGTIYHSHGVSAIVVANDTHNHSDGTLSAANDTHNHSDGTLSAANDTHNHTSGNLRTGYNSGTQIVTTGSGTTVAHWQHFHDVDSGSTANDTHNHDVSGSTANDTHDHDVSGSTANDTHNHGLSGTTDLSTDVAFPWHCGKWIQRVA